MSRAALVVLSLVGFSLCSHLLVNASEPVADSPPHAALPSTEVPIVPEPELAGAEPAEMTVVKKVEPSLYDADSYDTDSYDTAAQTADRIATLETEVRELKDHLSILENALADFVNGDISTAILGAMPQLREELSSSMQGRVNLLNFTGREVYIYINGVRWRAAVNESYVYAPVGKVSFQTNLSQPPVFDRDWKMQNGQMQLTYKIPAGQ